MILRSTRRVSWIVLIPAVLVPRIGWCQAQDDDSQQAIGLPFPLIGEEVTAAKVVAIGDDGVLRYRSPQEEADFRLASIRLPKIGTRLDRKAKTLLEKRLLGKRVEVHIRGFGDSEGVKRGHLLVAGHDVRIELVSEGLARYCPTTLREPELDAAQETARSSSRGIWKGAEKRSLPDCAGASSVQSDAACEEAVPAAPRHEGAANRSRESLALTKV